jgi:mannose-6-phosphate isomerase class I
MLKAGMRPILLEPVEMKKSWGVELWLNATLPEASARTAGGTLRELLRAHPEMLGELARRVFGDELPIFTKFLRADFPPLVHVGFSRAVDRATLLAWLTREHDLLRELFRMLEVDTREAFDAFGKIYSAWAIRQAGERWRATDAIADELARFAKKPLAATLTQLRENRAQLVEVLNEVDLRREAGNLLVTPAGLVHSIFGLSHQTHPLDRMRPTLEALFKKLRESSHLDDAQLFAIVDGVELNHSQEAPPKNEAWMPAWLDGQLWLVEPQQTSDTTYSIADFYTPFVWDGARMRFRKGDPTNGLSEQVLARQIEDLDFSPTQIDQIRRTPIRVAEKDGATLFRLVDEPEHWPFFTAYQVSLQGGRWTDRPNGVFQQLVVLSGEAELTDAGGSIGTLRPSTPAFVPASLAGEYHLSGTAEVLVFSVPGLRARHPGE